MIYHFLKMQIVFIRLSFVRGLELNKFVENQFQRQININFFFSCWPSFCFFVVCHSCRRRRKHKMNLIKIIIKIVLDSGRREREMQKLTWSVLLHMAALVHSLWVRTLHSSKQSYWNCERHLWATAGNGTDFDHLQILFCKNTLFLLLKYSKCNKIVWENFGLNKVFWIFLKI